jgi:hypothetical protein
MAALCRKRGSTERAIAFSTDSDLGNNHDNYVTPSAEGSRTVGVLWERQTRTRLGVTVGTSTALVIVQNKGDTA